MEPNELLNKFVSFYPRDSIIFREGESSTHIFFVKVGKILLLKKFNLSEKVIGIMNQGDVFGELALLENSNRISTARALEDSHVIKLDPKIVIELSSQNSEFMLNIFKSMALRILDLSDFLLDNLTMTELEFKIISRIIHFVQINFTIDKYIELNLVELLDFLSSYFSISEEKIILILERIQEKKLLTIQGEKITILDLNLLFGYTK
jgi:CRP/FNR family transcriptional regulator, cyclic AMP receptor protein